GARSAVGRASENQVAGEFDADRFDEVVVKAQEFERVEEVERPGNHPAQWMQCELEGGDDAEVSAASTQTPKQVGVLVGRRGEALAGGGDEPRADDVVARKANEAAPDRDSAAPRGPPH